MNNQNSAVCPVEYAGKLDSRFRRKLQNPAKILRPFIKPGMTVLDLGCGPGFFTLELARLVSPGGKVTAADLQQGMLDKVRQKIQDTPLCGTIELHRCGPEQINLTHKVDFILIFYVVHEVPDQQMLFEELKTILNPGGRILIIEPKFHVTKKAFAEMIRKANHAGMVCTPGPGIFFSRSIILENQMS